MQDKRYTLLCPNMSPFHFDYLEAVMKGAGCRASNYVGFIRKALIDAGYPHIPVLSLNFNKMEINSGFKISSDILIKLAFASVHGDLLMKMVLHTRPYEINKGQTNKLHEKWHDKLCDEF